MAVRIQFDTVLYFLPEEVDNMVVYAFLSSQSEEAGYKLAMRLTGLTSGKVHEIHMTYTNLIDAMRQHSMVVKYE